MVNFAFVLVNHILQFYKVIGLWALAVLAREVTASTDTPKEAARALAGKVNMLPTKMVPKSGVPNDATYSPASLLRFWV